MIKTRKIVMLHSTNPARIWQHYNTKRLSLRDYDTSYYLSENLYGNHLYILSDEAIKEGDWCINNNNNDTLYQPNCLGDNSNWKKVIATTDTSLNLPLIPQNFIKLYIEQYNLGSIITEVKVEYENNNTVNIKFIDLPKYTYSKQEVENLLIACVSYCKGKVYSHDIEWIEENL